MTIEDDRAEILAGKKFLSPREFAEIVGIGHRIIQRDCQRGKIKAEQVGSVFAIPASEVERYLANPRKKGPPFQGGGRSRRKKS
jgi:excisionase family DNA binding protein